MTSLTAAFSFIVALSGAIKGWPTIDPYMPALKYQVQATVDDVKKELRPIVNQLQLGDYGRELRRLERDKSEAEKEKAAWLIKLQAETDPATKTMIERRINQIDQDKIRLDGERVRVQGEMNKLKH